MAITIVPPQNITRGTIMSSTTKANKRMVHVRGLNSFGGLKANNGVISLGFPLSTEKCFAKIVSSVKIRLSNGGALSSTCNAAGEIFTIASIINGLVLVGVAIGFVLLRIEAFVEEQEVE